VWLVLPLGTPLYILGWFGGEFLAQEVGGGVSDQLLAPLGAAVPFALLALWLIRRQDQVIGGLTAELKRVNDEQLNKVTAALTDVTVLMREQTLTLNRVLDDVRHRPPPPS
jgi:hypothetical protein